MSDTLTSTIAMRLAKKACFELNRGGTTATIANTIADAGLRELVEASQDLTCMKEGWMLGDLVGKLERLRAALAALTVGSDK